MLCKLLQALQKVVKFFPNTQVGSTHIMSDNVYSLNCLPPPFKSTVRDTENLPFSADTPHRFSEGSANMRTPVQQFVVLKYSHNEWSTMLPCLPPPFKSIVGLNIYNNIAVSNTYMQTPPPPHPAALGPCMHILDLHMCCQQSVICYSSFDTIYMRSSDHTPAKSSCKIGILLQLRLLKRSKHLFTAASVHEQSTCNNHKTYYTGLAYYINSIHSVPLHTWFEYKTS